MKHLLIGAAVVALVAGPLAAQGNGKGQAGGHGKADHGPSMKGPAMQGPSMKASGHGNSGHAGKSTAPTMKPAASQQASDKARKRGHGPGKAQAPARAAAEKGPSAAARPGSPAPRDMHPGKAKPNGPNGKASVAARPGIRVLDDGRRYYTERASRDIFDASAVRLGPIQGCPPGLAKKNNGCLPPGQAKQRFYQPAWWGLTGLAAGPYAYRDGYLLRLDGDEVGGYIPLLGGALSPGNIWPSMYAPVTVPEYYVDYYDLGPAGGYRYADDVLYRVDPSTSAITSIVALLTGDDFRIGSPMPPGYDVYNVPYPYRSQYLDGPEARYRYSDGYIYQVDPTTQLVTAAIDLLAG